MFATCFQRDSVKDETVVIVFLIATIGLLAWAAVKPWVGRVREGAYLPLAPANGEGLASRGSRGPTGVGSMNAGAAVQNAVGRGQRSSGG